MTKTFLGKTDDEVMAEFYFRGLQYRGVSKFQASLRCRRMFRCTEEFWYRLTAIPTVKRGVVVSVVPEKIVGDWKPQGDYIVLDDPSLYGIVPALSNNNEIHNISVEWVKIKEN